MVEKGLLQDKLGTKCGIGFVRCHQRLAGGHKRTSIWIGRTRVANPLGNHRTFYTYKRFKQLSNFLNRLMI
ncbi:hypothetical protein MESS2_1130052 [Mesorhizobium metallidurans STM 2683]|uniref:Uncharacterized protein n=1 Tax=Mesorhizobium metallidurans STM 2683 TaxID=1297569 RepID=M5EHH4_9HYPH|nr:hypothetical protein MESS2_1130052 [Mesorhizobium metallidurans STM 2683]